MDATNIDSRRIVFFRQYVTPLFWLGLMPNYDFETRKVVIRKWKTSLLLLRVPLFLLLHIYLVWQRWNDFNRNSSMVLEFPQLKIHFGILLICDLLGLFIVVIALKETVKKWKEWETFFGLMFDLESSLHMNMESLPEGLFRKQILQNRCAHSVIWSYVILTTASVAYYGDYNVASHCISLYYMYISLLILGLQANLNMVVKSRYRNVNNKVITCQPKSLSDVTELATEIRRMYHMMNKAVENLNSIFTCDNGVIFLYLGFEMLRIYFECYFFYMPMFHVRYELNFNVSVYIFVVTNVSMTSGLLLIVVTRRRYLTYIRYEKDDPDFPQRKIHVAIIMMCDFVGFCIVNSFLKTTVFKSAEWSQVFNLMLELESSSHLNLVEISTEKYLRNGLVQNRCAHLLIWTYIIAAIISTRFYEPHFDALTHFTSYYYFYVSLLVLGLQVNLTLSIKLKYRAVCDCVVDHQKSSATQTMEFVTKIKSMYILMSRIVANLNMIFGTNNDLIFLYSGFALLRTYFEAYFFLLPNYIGESDYSYSFSELVFITMIICLLTCLIMCGILLATFCCDLAVKESQKIAAACRRRMLQYPQKSQEYLEFENLAEHVTRIRPMFTAAGCWEINRSTVFSLITGCGTYFIILIQYFKEW